MKINGKEYTLQMGQSLYDILVACKMNPQSVVVEKNGKIVTRENFGCTDVQDEDVLEVVSFVGGG